VSHTGPDVIQAADTYLGAAVAAGAYSSITPGDWQLAGGKGRFIPGALAKNLIGTPKTGPVVVPQWLNANLMAYNTKLFKEAGIAGPPTTWAQYVADGEKITKLGHGIYGSDFFPMDPLPWHLIFLIAAEYGGSFVNPGGTAATLTSAPVQKAVKFWFDLYTKFHIAPPQSINWTSTQANAAFAAGKLGMINLQTEAVLSTVKGQPAQGDVAFAPEPSVAYGQSTATGGKLFKSEVFSWDLGVTKWSKDPSLAYRFINIATDPTNEAILVKAYQDLPSTKAALAGIPASSPLREFTKYVAEGVAAPQSAAWVTVEEATGAMTATLARDVQNHTYSNSTIMQALTKADEQIDASLSQSG
jgi:multiple sugar transport system substrate-binding protein